MLLSQKWLSAEILKFRYQARTRGIGNIHYTEFQYVPLLAVAEDKKHQTIMLFTNKLLLPTSLFVSFHFFVYFVHSYFKRKKSLRTKYSV